MTDPTDDTTIGSWWTFMRPILEVLEDGQTWAKRDMERAVSDRVGLTAEQRSELLASGQTRATNRIGWATSALRRAKALTAPSRGSFQITDTGRQLLQIIAGEIRESDLETHAPAYNEYVPARRQRASEPTSPTTASTVADQSPDDLIDAGIQLIEDDTKVKLLDRLRGTDPTYFETVVLRLLVKMGYGRDGKMTKLAGSGDGGLDGVIDRDELGLSKIYIQAKRYAEEVTIGRPKIQEFVGALATRSATVGVFFTTSRFTREAVETAERVHQDVALVDGIRLTELMIKHRVGVEVARTVDIVKLDEDFFADE
ncbi:restriction endonuclease [Microbacterium awajiense]|uniref:Restriction endonuclease n=1 Tax=Microbacterium awajiense TaxID=415214 RepID=A0ABP7AT58_9MICO